MLLPRVHFVVVVHLGDALDQHLLLLLEGLLRFILPITTAPRPAQVGEVDLELVAVAREDVLDL